MNKIIQLGCLAQSSSPREAESKKTIVQQAVNEALGNNHRLSLVDPVSGVTYDLSADFQGAISVDAFGVLGSEVWTPDGNYLIAGNNLIQPKPFKMILSMNQPLRWSPVSGWLLLQGQMAFRWVNYSGNLTSPIHGWPNDWVWSSKGHYAARIDKGNLSVFKPELPPQTNDR